ncbi:MAG: hemolysin III family protein [Clostridia bacterium]|nr:hemolysin III family protein [Clostridia bacterium]
MAQSRKRTKLCDRLLPDYTRGEEIFNTVSHIVGGGFGIIALVLCVLISALHGNPWAVVGSAIYGGSMVLLYTVSSVYHGLHHPMAKKVMQVIDHCTIYLLIAGTYTPILLCNIRQVSPGWAWTLFGIVWGLAAMAATLTAIDLKKYEMLSMVCYIGMGWCILLAAKTAIQAIPLPGLLWLLAGGIAYTVGAVLYGLGKKRRYMHSIFHLFVVLGSILQCVCIAGYVL